MATKTGTAFARSITSTNLIRSRARARPNILTERPAFVANRRFYFRKSLTDKFKHNRSFAGAISAAEFHDGNILQLVALFFKAGLISRFLYVIYKERISRQHAT